MLMKFIMVFSLESIQTQNPLVTLMLQSLLKKHWALANISLAVAKPLSTDQLELSF